MKILGGKKLKLKCKCPRQVLKTVFDKSLTKTRLTEADHAVGLQSELSLLPMLLLLLHVPVQALDLIQVK